RMGATDCRHEGGNPVEDRPLRSGRGPVLSVQSLRRAVVEGPVYGFQAAAPLRDRWAVSLQDQHPEIIDDLVELEGRGVHGNPRVLGFRQGARTVEAERPASDRRQRPRDDLHRLRRTPDAGGAPPHHEPAVESEAVGTGRYRRYDPDQERAVTRTPAAAARAVDGAG